MQRPQMVVIRIGRSDRAQFYHMLASIFEMEDLKTHKNQVQSCLNDAFVAVVADVLDIVFRLGRLLQKGWIFFG